MRERILTNLSMTDHPIHKLTHPFIREEFVGCPYIYDQDSKYVLEVLDRYLRILSFFSHISIKRYTPKDKLKVESLIITNEALHQCSSLL